VFYRIFPTHIFKEFCMKKRCLFFGLLFLAALLILAGCGGDDDGGFNPGGGYTSPPPENPPPENPPLENPENIPGVPEGVPVLDPAALEALGSSDTARKASLKAMFEAAVQPYNTQAGTKLNTAITVFVTDVAAAVAAGQAVGTKSKALSETLANDAKLTGTLTATWNMPAGTITVQLSNGLVTFSSDEAKIKAAGIGGQYGVTGTETRAATADEATVSLTESLSYSVLVIRNNLAARFSVTYDFSDSGEDGDSITGSGTMNVYGADNTAPLETITLGKNDYPAYTIPVGFGSPPITEPDGDHNTIVINNIPDTYDGYYASVRVYPQGSSIFEETGFGLGVGRVSSKTVTVHLVVAVVDNNLERPTESGWVSTAGTQYVGTVSFFNQETQDYVFIKSIGPIPLTPKTTTTIPYGNLPDAPPPSGTIPGDDDGDKEKEG
jgi:hypothetical protein